MKQILRLGLFAVGCAVLAWTLAFMVSSATQAANPSASWKADTWGVLLFPGLFLVGLPFLIPRSLARPNAGSPCPKCGAETRWTGTRFACPRCGTEV